VGAVAADAGERGSALMIFWTCGAISLGGALAAAFSRNMKAAILALWVAGLGAGGMFLALGAEMLGVVQWLVSTIIALAFVFYAVMFGEYGKESSTEPRGRSLLRLVLPIFAGIALAAVVMFGAKELAHVSDPAQVVQGPLAIPAKGSGQDLVAMGRALAHDNLVSIEILALLLFLTVIGAGVITRPEEKNR
jgi:NADH:ubiquinone oxidoreductase subunit 6 (subunit J)